MRFLISTTLSLILFTSCTYQSHPKTEDRIVLDSLRAEHVRAVNSRNADLLLSSMSEDIVYLAPEAPPTIGKDTLNAMIEPAYDAYDPDITMTPRQVVIDDNIAYEWGCLGGTLTQVESGTITANNGKYLFIYRRNLKTGWKIVMDIYNMGPCS